MSGLHGDKVTNIVNDLSELIRDALVAEASESTNPSFSPDRMDDTIKFQKERVGTLRKLRMEFEDEMARQQPYGG